ncbi:MAG: hypothetical protein QOJ51_2252, partial [Acidobacteriaceae bacterium]|nr:hypothetical protein [Acidobacteriaceae bacterium]
APWWKQIRLEVFGWQPKQNKVLIKNQTADRAIPLEMESLPQGVLVNLADDGKGMELQLR